MTEQVVDVFRLVELLREDAAKLESHTYAANNGDMARADVTWERWRHLHWAADAIEALETQNGQLRQDRSDALNVRSRDGLLSSEWVARTGKAERERDEALALLSRMTCRAELAECRAIEYLMEKEAAAKRARKNIP